MKQFLDNNQTLEESLAQLKHSEAFKVLKEELRATREMIIRRSQEDQVIKDERMLLACTMYAKALDDLDDLIEGSWDSA